MYLTKTFWLSVFLSQSLCFNSAFTPLPLSLSLYLSVSLSFSCLSQLYHSFLSSISLCLHQPTRNRAAHKTTTDFVCKEIFQILPAANLLFQQRFYCINIFSLPKNRRHMLLESYLSIHGRLFLNFCLKSFFFSPYLVRVSFKRNELRKKIV